MFKRDHGMKRDVFICSGQISELCSAQFLMLVSKQIGLLGRRSCWSLRELCHTRWWSGQPGRPLTRWAHPCAVQSGRRPGWPCRRRWWSAWMPTCVGEDQEVLMSRSTPRSPHPHPWSCCKVGETRRPSLKATLSLEREEKWHTANSVLEDCLGQLSFLIS